MGSKLLKVISILTIIFAGIAIVIAVLGMTGAGLLAAGGVNMGMYWFALILGLVGAAIELIAGILGVKNWNKPEKAQTCIICGIAVIAFTLISDIISFVSYSAGFGWFSAILGLVIPVLYLIGAFQLKNGTQE